MAQTKPKAGQFYGVSGNGTAGQVLISDGNGGMSWGANTEQFTVSWATPTGQSLTYTQPNPQSSTGALGSSFPTTTFTVTPPSGEEISGTATIAGLPAGITATQSLSGGGANNILTVTLTGVFPGADSLNTALTLSGLTVVVPAPLVVSYLVVAGGGSGGSNSNSGGAGAGGYRTNYGSTALEILPSTTYNITVGAGGTANVFGSGVNGNNGNNSVFNIITSTAGGAGGAQGQTPGTGGSGGGGGYDRSGSAGNAGGFSPVEGYAGGSGTQSGDYPGGGGGGASEVGNTNANGHGGDGLSNSITGSAVFYSGGGGAGVSTNATTVPGGNGGGGQGGEGTTAAIAGTAYTGGGGGGGSASLGGGAGGSGVVILRYPNSFTLTGLSGTTTIVGSDKITRFTNAGTGNIQFN